MPLPIAKVTDENYTKCDKLDFQFFQVQKSRLMPAFKESNQM